MSPIPEFSWVTILLLACGWATHWLVVVRKARSIAAAAGKPLPSLRSYWTADPYSLGISLVGIVAGYFVLPWVAQSWPELAAIIGATKEQPMNPLVAYMGGIVTPWLADLAGKRLAAMVPAGVAALLVALGLMLPAAPAAAQDRVAQLTIEVPAAYEDGTLLPPEKITTIRAFWSTDGENWLSGGETAGAATTWDVRLPSDVKCGLLYFRVLVVISEVENGSTRSYAESPYSDPAEKRYPCRPGKPRIISVEIKSAR